MKILSVALLGLFVVVNRTWSEEPKPISSPEPEMVIRKVLMSMLTNDSAEVKKWILPNPDAEVLWQGESPPKETLPEIEKQINAIPLRRLVVGETVNLANGKKLTITTEQVNENSLWIVDTSEPGPPFILVKKDGQWKVDAGPIIAGRKAAQRFRERQTSN